jgi:hypothetical protein
VARVSTVAAVNPLSDARSVVSVKLWKGVEAIAQRTRALFDRPLETARPSSRCYVSGTKSYSLLP